MMKWVLVAILKGSIAVNVPGLGVGYEYPMAKSFDIFDTEKECDKAKREFMATEAYRTYRADCLPVMLTRSLDAIR